MKPPKENGSDESGTARKQRQVDDKIRDYSFVAAGDSDVVAFSPEDALSYTASGMRDLQHGLYSLFIYYDMVEPVVVDNVKAHIFRTANI